MRKILAGLSLLIMTVTAAVICPQKAYATEIMLTQPWADLGTTELSVSGLTYSDPVQDAASVINPALTYIDVDIANQTLTYFVNGTVALSGQNAYWDVLLKDVMAGICKAIKKEKLRVGHVKVIAENGKQYAVGNITGDASTLQLRGTAGRSDNVKLIINARVETTPEHLDEIIRDVLVEAIDGKYKDEVLAWRYLQPGCPNPTHRILE